jgi:hypothetical protein
MPRQTERWKMLAAEGSGSRFNNLGAALHDRLPEGPWPSWFQILQVLPLIDSRHIQERYHLLEELILRGIETLNKEAPEER